MRLHPAPVAMLFLSLSWQADGLQDLRRSYLFGEERSRPVKAAGVPGILCLMSDATGIASAVGTRSCLVMWLNGGASCFHTMHCAHDVSRMATWSRKQEVNMRKGAGCINSEVLVVVAIGRDSRMTVFFENSGSWLVRHAMLVAKRRCYFYV
jgi:hypothetical protein